MSQLISAHLPCLKELVLEGSNLGNEGVIQLVKGKWRLLENLNLQNNRLDNHCLGALLEADWSCSSSTFLTTGLILLHIRSLVVQASHCWALFAMCLKAADL